MREPTLYGDPAGFARSEMLKRIREREEAEARVRRHDARRAQALAIIAGLQAEADARGDRGERVRVEWMMLGTGAVGRWLSPPDLAQRAFTTIRWAQE